jgi:dTDP-4-amino-4,6-dideoxygalactose transaminase
VVRPVTLEGNEHVWHLYVIRIPGGTGRRDAVLAKLHEAGVGAGIHYPYPVHRTGAFAHLGGSFPNAEAAGPELLSLPIYPQITPAQQERVAGELAAALR